MAERLQKWLASAGLGSRRAIEGWIAEGRVKVNGRPAVLGLKVSGTERITIDGELVRGLSARHRSRPRVLVYHKPVGEVCTRTDPEGRPTVFDSLPRVSGGRWVIVGRLDIDTSGLLLFTTDGALAHGLMHPSSELKREYAVRVRGNPPEAELRRLLEGVTLDDGPGRFEELHPEGGEGANRWYRVCVSEGRNRIIRRLWESIGCQVSRLIRVQFGPVTLPRHLPRGEFRELGAREMAAIYEAVGVPLPEEIAATEARPPRNTARKIIKKQPPGR